VERAAGHHRIAGGLVDHDQILIAVDDRADFLGRHVRLGPGFAGALRRCGRLGRAADAGNILTPKGFSGIETPLHALLRAGCQVPGTLAHPWLAGTRRSARADSGELHL
jgi:hypothetical protein